MIKNIITSLFATFKPLLYIALVVVAPFAIYFVISYFRFLLFWKKKGIKPKRIGNYRKLPRRNAFQKIFIDVPKMIAYNWQNRHIGAFKEHGIIIFEGKQGQGKTLSITQQLLDMQFRYPDVKVITNYGYNYENEEFDDWHRLIDYNNGEKGVIAAIDELPNWFSSADSKNFPPEMLEVVTQNRKNRRVIYGTCHTFSMVAKPVRIQTRYLVKCRTFLKVLTIQNWCEPIFNSSGDVEKMNHIKWKFFVHSPLLYGAYDTYRVIERYKERETLDIEKALSNSVE